MWRMFATFVKVTVALLSSEEKTCIYLLIGLADTVVTKECTTDDRKLIVRMM